VAEGAGGGAAVPRRPEWLKVTLPGGGEYAGTRALLRAQRLTTVCEGARCPNLGHCWERGTATIMILGERCTRRCGFCAVAPGRPDGRVDEDEPRRVGEAVAAMGLRHAVVTSVTRDDLPDGGSAVFARVIAEIRARCRTAIEVLIPDFQGRAEDLQRVIDARPDVINHNVETVERLQRTVRPSADYRRSLELLRRVRERGAGIRSKSGIMLGLGETDDEVERTLSDLRAVGCELLTIGQYLRPTPRHLPVAEYVHPDRFAHWARRAGELGFANTASGPLVRSSFHADELASPRGSGEGGATAG
jgi:lipoic acid synthetase